MTNLKHPQLDPNLNRTRRTPGSAASVVRMPNPDLFQPDVDPKDPYKPTHTGLFDGSITDENGVLRPYTVYVPSTMKTSGNMALVFIESGKKARAFIEECVKGNFSALATITHTQAEELRSRIPEKTA